jgi:hypothetical protein
MYWDYEDAFPSMTPEEEERADQEAWEAERIWGWLSETWSEEWQLSFESDNLQGASPHARSA